MHSLWKNEYIENVLRSLMTFSECAIAICDVGGPRPMSVGVT
jgi:hypothetical protein